MAKVDLKNETLGTIASIQTLLERYPILITTNPRTGDTSFSFMLNILKTIGVTEDMILNWLSKLLSEKDGLLDVLEGAIKALILSTFKSTYTCSINPVLPMSLMYKNDESYPEAYGNGIDVCLSDIDIFGLLNNCPTTESGSIYYFDNTYENSSQYTPNSIYRSTDFNAFLWYVINRGNGIAGDFEQRRRCTWDNRVVYRKRFETNNQYKNRFFNTTCTNSAMRMIRNVGPKKETIICSYYEEGEQTENISDYIKVFLNGYRYIGKTVFDFNFDYITNIKLFDSKTLAAQITNAVLGLNASMGATISLPRAVMAEKIRNVVKNIIVSTDETKIEDCFYSFSNDEYNAMLKKANQLSNPSDIVTSKETDIYAELNKIGATENKNESVVISNTFKQISDIIDSSEEENGNYDDKDDIISLFINETITQLVLQVLSPKIMLLYAINEKFLDPEADNSEINVLDFFKKFQNLMVSLVMRVNEIIMKEMFDYLMGQIKPLIVMFIEKLLLETAYYYRILLTQLLTSCSMLPTNLSFSGRKQPLMIDEVVGADIIPSETEPNTDKKC